MLTGLYHICSTLWVNQFELKGMCIEFVISTFSAQGNNVKMKLKLKVEEICRDCRLDFLLENDIAPGFYLVLSEVYSEPCETS